MHYFFAKVQKKGIPRAQYQYFFVILRQIFNIKCNKAALHHAESCCIVQESIIKNYVDSKRNPRFLQEVL